MNTLKYIIKWIFTAFTDTDRFGLSLSRTMFTSFCVLAFIIWSNGNDIKEYHFYSIMICLGYLFFKTKFLDVISSAINAYVNVKSPSISEAAKTDDTDGGNK